MRTNAAQRRVFYGIACLWLAFALPSRVLGQTAGAPGSIFDFGAGARPLSMGGAYSAMVKDATSLYYNPAGLSMLSNRNVSLMHATLFQSMTYDYFGYAQNYGRLPGGWGIEVLKFAGGSAPGRDENNLATTDFTYSETAFALGTGIHGVFLPGLSMGASIKMLNRTLADESNRLIGFDLGAQYGPLLSDKLTLAFSVRNFGSFAMGDTEDKLPLNVKMGAAYALGSNISICLDMSSGGSFQFGTEYGIGPAALRLGYDQTAFSFGAGLKFLKSYQIDYAMLKHPVLGLSNRVSVGYYFGGVAAPPKIRVFAEDYVNKAEGDIKDRNYVQAADHVDMSMGMDPSVQKGAWGEKSRKLNGVITGLKLRELPARQKLLKEDTPQAIEAGRAIEEYLEGNNDKSSLLAHSALGYQPGNAFFSDFLSVMSGLTHSEIKKDEILPRQLLINAKIDKGSSAFYAQNFEKVVKECSDVLLIDDKNIIAWKKLGSAYFALGDKAGAKRAYEKVLSLDPHDDSVSRFMTLQGWR